jgi:hypothetical protein
MWDDEYTAEVTIGELVERRKLARALVNVLGEIAGAKVGE